MSRAFDPGKAVGEAVHIFKGDQRAPLLLVPRGLVSRAKYSIKTISFYPPPLHVCPVGGDLQHVVEDGAPGGQADGGDIVRAVTIVDILEKEAGS